MEYSQIIEEIGASMFNEISIFYLLNSKSKLKKKTINEMTTIDNNYRIIFFPLF